MRKLATFAGAFAAAVFFAVYLLPEGVLPLLSGASVLLCALCLLLLRKRRRLRLRAALVCAGFALGLLWTALYTQIFFQPARALDDTTVRLEAEAADWPQAGTYGGYSVLVRVRTSSGVNLSAVLYTDGQGEDLRPGDKISTVAHCTLGDRTFAGEQITYYTAKGIFLRAAAYGGLKVERPDHIPVRYWPAVLSRGLKAGIDAAFPPEAAPLIRALVTGNRDNLTDQFTTSLQRAGLSHTVAVSGMHMAFLASLLTALLGRGKRRTALFTALAVLVFCGVAGNTPSVVRAAVMILLLQLAPLADRERDGPTALAVALFLLLAWNPFSAAHVGLQLSFGAVAGILLVSDRIQDWALERFGLNKWSKSRWVRWARKVPRFAVSTLAATFGASVLTIPLVAFHFGTFSLISPLSNLLTLWAVAVLFTAGLLLGLLGMGLPSLAAVLAVPFTFLARYLNWVVGALGSLPLAAIPLSSVYYRAWMVLLCLLVGTALLLPGKKRPQLAVFSGAVTLAAAVLLTNLSFRSGEMSVTVLNVGQGQSVLVRLGDFLVLSDCGGDSYDSAGDIAADCVQAAGRGKLDLLVVSHYHDDHANGVPQLLRRLDVAAVALPDVEEDSPLRREILELAAQRGTEVRFVREDQTIELGEGRSLTLFAPLGTGTDTNELGLTLLASAGERDVLIPGDMPGQVERLLLEHADLPDTELLVAGHHGSDTSTTRELLEAIRPELAAVSVGEGNRYGHPAWDTLVRLKESGAEIYRTDLHGTLTFRFDP